jgi:hypothetical protein
MEIVPVTSLGVMSQSPKCMGVWSIFEINPSLTWDDADPELVYLWVKWLDENYDLYKVYLIDSIVVMWA